MKAALWSFLLVASPAFAAQSVSGEGLISALIYIIVIGIVCWLLWWLIGYIGLPEPFNKVARVLIAVVAVLILINLILGFAGHPIVVFR